MASNIIEEIRSLTPNMTQTQKVIASSITLDPMQAAFSSVKELAEKISVSPASIVRFSHLVAGKGGYPELQSRIREYVKTYYDPVKRLTENTAAVSHDSDLLAQVYETQIDNMQKTYSRNLADSIPLAADLISGADHVYTFGSRGSYTVAYYLGHHLNRVLNNTDIVQNNERLTDFLMRITDKDVAVFVCMPRYDSKLYSAIKKLHDVGTKIISIVGSPQAPYVAYSDISMVAYYNSDDFHNSLIPAMLIAEMLLTQVISDNLTRALDNLGNMESLFSDMSQFDINDK